MGSIEPLEEPEAAASGRCDPELKPAEPPSRGDPEAPKEPEAPPLWTDPELPEAPEPVVDPEGLDDPLLDDPEPLVEPLLSADPEPLAATPLPGSLHAPLPKTARTRAPKAPVTESF